MLTIVVGPNTAGKTSLLEAIMLIATGRSFRAAREAEVILFDEEVGRVQLTQQSTINPTLPRLRGAGNQQSTDILEVVITGGTVLGKKAPYKKFTINNVSKRSVDFVGQMPAVLFWPEDLRLVTGSPSRRRQYLDIVLSQSDRSYHRSVITYEKALRIRNKLLHLLRDGSPIRPEEFEYWTDTLLMHGTVIHNVRREYIKFVNTVKIDHKTNRTNKSNKPGRANRTVDTEFEMHYDHSTITTERLAKYKSAEQGAAVTLIGPHRDDFYLTKNHDSDRELHSFGSRGEQRLGVLWLKVAELQYIEQRTTIKPLLLLDDIFSELDQEHRDLVMRLVDKQQTIMTTTDSSAIDNSKDPVIITL